MTTVEARRLFVMLAVPFFLCTVAFLALRDTVSGGRVRGGDTQGLAYQAADSTDWWSWFPDWLIRPPQYRVDIPDDYLQRRAPTAEQDAVTVAIESEIAVLTNMVRTHPVLDLSTLSSDSTLAGVARGHSRDMVVQDFYSPHSPGGLALADRVNRDRPSLQGEARGNVFRLTNAKDFPPQKIAEEAMLSWLNVPSKRSRLLWPDCDAMGVGVWRKGDDTYYITQVFFKPEVRFKPALEMRYRRGTVQIDGEFVERPDKPQVTMSLVTAPGFFDILRRLGYRPRKVIDLQPQWVSPTEFTVSLPCRARGFFEMRLYDRGRLVGEHIFRVG